jgi:quinol monooxygenase YgiN
MSILGMEEYLPLPHAHRARYFQDEPGTLQVDVLRPIDNLTNVMIYVVYRDEEACDAHRDGPSRARHYQESDVILLGASGTKCAVLDSPSHSARINIETFKA